MEDACDLHVVLHFTGGKVGAAPLWRKSLDTALANAWSTLKVLRTTFVQCRLLYQLKRLRCLIYSLSIYSTTI